MSSVKGFIGEIDRKKSEIHKQIQALYLESNRLGLIRARAVSGPVGLRVSEEDRHRREYRVREAKEVMGWFGGNRKFHDLYQRLGHAKPGTIGGVSMSEAEQDEFMIILQDHDYPIWDNLTFGVDFVTLLDYDPYDYD